MAASLLLFLDLGDAFTKATLEWEEQHKRIRFPSVVAEVLASNPGPAEDFKNGKDRALGFLVGQVMKKTQGKANPKLVNELIRKSLVD